MWSRLSAASHVIDSEVYGSEPGLRHGRRAPDVLPSETLRCCRASFLCLFRGEVRTLWLFFGGNAMLARDWLAFCDKALSFRV